MVQINIGEPTTREEAASIAEQYRRATEAAPDPGPTKITRYVKFQPPIRTLQDLLPFSPCEGPPVPRFTGLLWPKWIRDPIYIYGKKGKPHRQMELDNLPGSIPDIHCYVLGCRLEGDFKSTLENISSEIEIPGGGDISTTLTTAEEDLREKIIDAFKQANVTIPVRKARDYFLSKAIEFKGAWSVIKALWDILVHKKIKVHLDIPTKIEGYETADYIVDTFNKVFSIDAEVKVENLHWHAW